jgi:hypothetical protein
VRAIMKNRGLLIGIAVVATAGLSACSASRAPSSAGAGNGQPAIPAATTPGLTSPVSATPPATTPTATPTNPGGVQNLVITSAEKSALTAAYAAFRAIPLSDIAGGGPLAGSAYYAYVPATGKYWAFARFEPSSTASLASQVGFQDGGGIGQFWKAGVGPWHVGNGGMPVLCGYIQWFPRAVLTAWALPTTPPAGMVC